LFDQVVKESEDRMEKVIERTKKEFSMVRTGRATPSLLEGIKADYYGTPTPINQMAKISVPESRQLVIQPWDKNAIKPIEKAILKSDLGLNPNVDADLIRLVIPQLTEERRKELVRVVRNKAEEQRVAVRNIRRDANEDLKEMENNGDISEDNYHRGLENVQELTNSYIEKIDELLEEKEAEIMEV